MNKLEQAIVDGARAAQREYESMTGWWLSHGPESFIEHHVAHSVSSKAGFIVFPEASPRKILEEKNERPKGRPASNLGQRFDIVVWYKAKNDVRAVVEIKRAWTVSDLRSDRDKVEKFVKANNRGNGTGYLLVYTEAKGRSRAADLSEKVKRQRRRDTLEKRLADWERKLARTHLVGSVIDDRGDGTWGWAFGLFRVSPE
jgi:hypothetical protein